MDNGKENIEPIKSQKEANEVFKSLVEMTLARMDISRKQAEKRITRLIKSNDLNGLLPDSPSFQLICDYHMATPA